jgi:hypothetical protein
MFPRSGRRRGTKAARRRPGGHLSATAGAQAGLGFLNSFLLALDVFFDEQARNGGSKHADEARFCPPPGTGVARLPSQHVMDSRTIKVVK